MVLSVVDFKDFADEDWLEGVGGVLESREF
jgi:hypothetical protein